MKKIVITLLAIPLSLLGLACKDPGPTPKPADTGGGSVAIVNLDTISKGMGWDEDIHKNLQQTEMSIGEQLQTAMRPNQMAIEAKRAEITKTANLTPAQFAEFNAAKSRADLEKLGFTSKQIDELEQGAASLNGMNNTVRQVIQQQLAAQHERIVVAYREAIKPAVNRVAIANNKAIVLAPGPDILIYNESAADLSGKVVDELQRSGGAKVELPPIPVLQGPRIATTGPATMPTTVPKP